MTEEIAPRTPFVLGKPIKNPADFYGRQAILRELFDAALRAELVAVAGEHRCGNTSVIYQMLHPEVRARYLSPSEDHGLLFVLVSSQLAAEGPEALFRRIARSLRRADPDARADFTGPADQVWLEDYLEDLADRHRRLVLLVDEFEVLASFDLDFWSWFENLVTGYDVSMVVTTRLDLGEFRAARGAGPPFFNMFRTVYVGSFTPETVDIFLREKSEITDFEFMAVKPVIDELAGRFPYYIQVAAALFYLHAGGDSESSEAHAETVRSEFRARTSALFDDAWHKLPLAERDALTWLVLGQRPEGPDEQVFRQALQSLERRAYVVDGRIFSSAFADFVHEQVRRISVAEETGRVRVGRRLIDLPPKALAMLRYFVQNDGRVATKANLVDAVWPEQAAAGHVVSDAMIEEVVREIQLAIESEEQKAPHIEHIPGHGYRFVNARL